MSALLAVSLGGQLCGLAVEQVREVLGPRAIAEVPLAPRAVAGLLNLRGRIVTAIDLRRLLGLEDRPEDEAGMNVVVEHGGALYGLAVDSVGAVLNPPADSLEPCPATLDAAWRRVADCVCRLEDRLLVVLDAPRLLETRLLETQGESDEVLPRGR